MVLAAGDCDRNRISNRLRSALAMSFNSCGDEASDIRKVRAAMRSYSR